MNKQSVFSPVSINYYAYKLIVIVSHHPPFIKSKSVASRRWISNKKIQLNSVRNRTGYADVGGGKKRIRKQRRGIRRGRVNLNPVYDIPRDWAYAKNVYWKKKNLFDYYANRRDKNATRYSNRIE